jgi:hypothetical protein
LNKIIGTEINTYKGIGIIDKFYYTDLNILMVKIRFNKVWVNFRVESLPDIKEKILNNLNT